MDATRENKQPGPSWPLVGVILAGLLVVTSTALVNIGIIAMDDYTDVIARIIPAGHQSSAQLIAAAGIRTPVPSLVLSGIAQAAQVLGISDPANQLRFVLVLLGIWAYGSSIYCLLFLFKEFQDPKRTRQLVAAFLVGFYFLSPLALTRPMFESLCAPMLFLSATFAQRYWRESRVGWLVIALAFLTLACLFRFQAGVCLLALVILPVWKKRWRDLVLLALAGLLAFLGTGLVDLWLRGEFQASLKAYLQYNLSFSSSYGITPFYTFALLLFGMSIPPFFIARYCGLDWKKEYRPLLLPLLYFLLFVAAHSVVPHKEERFMIPILPIFLVLLAPLASYFIRAKLWLRPILFTSINLILLALTSYNIAQNNVVELGIFLHHHPKITSVQSVGSTLVLNPQAYVGRAIDWQNFAADQTAAKAASIGVCSAVVVCRQDLLNQNPQLVTQFKEVATFRPGVLEALLIKLNPAKNFRRGPIGLFVPRGCS